MDKQQMDKKDIVNDFFKAKLQDYAPPVKRDLWASLESHIPAEPLAGTTRPDFSASAEKSSGRRFYQILASAAAVIIILLLSYPYIFKKSSGLNDLAVVATEEPASATPSETTREKEPGKEVTEESFATTDVSEDQTLDQTQKKSTAVKDRILPSGNRLTQESCLTQESRLAQENRLVAENLPDRDAAVIPEIDIAAKAKTETATEGEAKTIAETGAETATETETETATESKTRQVPETEETRGKTADTPKEMFPEKPAGYKKQDYAYPKAKKNSRQGVQVAVSGKNFIAMNNELDNLKIFNSGYLKVYENQFKVDDWFPAKQGGTSTGGDPEWVEIPVDYTLTHIKYHTPVSLSLYVSKHITSRWALETGVSYTKLTSRETWEGRQTYYYEDALFSDIDLYYLGIPLRASYYIVNKPRLSFYVTGGGMIEKCVSGKAVTWSKKQDERIRTKPDIPELQFSVTGGAGVGYRLFRPVILFVEPGVVYYFDDGSHTMTIRKDKPFNFNIQGGLRFSF